MTSLGRRTVVPVVGMLCLALGGCTDTTRSAAASKSSPSPTASTSHSDETSDDPAEAPLYIGEWHVTFQAPQGVAANDIDLYFYEGDNTEILVASRELQETADRTLCRRFETVVFATIFRSRQPQAVDPADEVEVGGYHYRVHPGHFDDACFPEELADGYRETYFADSVVQEIRVTLAVAEGQRPDSV